MQTLAVLSAVLSALAVTTAVIETRDLDFTAYVTHVDHNQFVPQMSDVAAGALAAALVGVAVSQWFAPTPLLAAGVALVSTVTWLGAAAEVSRDRHHTRPGPAVWLGWAAVMLSNWALASKFAPNNPQSPRQ